MKRLGTDTIVYRFAADLIPALEVDPGEEVLFETLDSWSGRLKRPEDILVVPMDPNLANPATGPVYVRGAQPGDALIAEILHIELAAEGWAKVTPSGGILGGSVAGPRARIVRVQGDSVFFDERISFPIRPMVGVIGVAPAGEPVLTLHPGPHGGNLDINEIAPGAKVYLPVSTPGALFALGDVHARMGDGEFSGAGLDICAKVRVRLGVAKGMPLLRPLIETPAAWATCATAPTVAEAFRLAVADMVAFLQTRLGLGAEDAFMLVSAAGDGRPGQAAGGGVDATARVVFPKVAGL